MAKGALACPKLASGMGRSRQMRHFRHVDPAKPQTLPPRRRALEGRMGLCFNSFWIFFYAF